MSRRYSRSEAAKKNEEEKAQSAKIKNQIDEMTKRVTVYQDKYDNVMNDTRRNHWDTWQGDFYNGIVDDSKEFLRGLERGLSINTQDKIKRDRYLEKNKSVCDKLNDNCTITGGRRYKKKRTIKRRKLTKRRNLKSRKVK